MEVVELSVDAVVLLSEDGVLPPDGGGGGGADGPDGILAAKTSLVMDPVP